MSEAFPAWTPRSMPTTTVRSMPGVVMVISRRPNREPTVDALTPQQARELAAALLDAATQPTRLCTTLTESMNSGQLPPRSERL